VSTQLSKNVNLLNERKTNESQFSNWNIIASGNNGEIAINPEGTRVVKRMLERKKQEENKPEFGPYEVEIGTKMGKLGHSPKIYSSSPSHIEMDLAPGKPLWQTFKKGDEEPVMNLEQARKAGYAFRDLHRMGYFHGDAHSQQFLVDGNNVKMVDFGLSGLSKDNPIKVMQDLAKISALVQWGTPELQNDSYFQLVNRYLPDYRSIGKSTSKGSKEKRRKLAEAYLDDLSRL
jgi:tRNA A-37 threonylcarbamoyl transferase component Bud32